MNYICRSSYHDLNALARVVSAPRPPPPATTCGHWLCGLSLASASTFALMACAADGPAQDLWADVTFTDRVHVMPVPDAPGGTPIAAPTPAVVPDGPHLTYHGGKVIQNVRVTQVLYGQGTYIPELTSPDGANMASAYSQMLTSGLSNRQDDSHPGSPAQAIGQGSFAGSVQITPEDSRNGSTI